MTRLFLDYVLHWAVPYLNSSNCLVWRS
jgi:hypothetical protein